MADKTNKLTYVSQRSLEKWVRDNWTQIESKRPTFQEAANWATKELGFDVTKGNVGGMVDILELIWPNTVGRSYKGGEWHVEIGKRERHELTIAKFDGILFANETLWASLQELSYCVKQLALDVRASKAIPMTQKAIDTLNKCRNFYMLQPVITDAIEKAMPHFKKIV